jgi:hypothetical protein
LNEQAFSNLIFEEMQIDDVEKEYQKTKTERNRYLEEITKGNISKEKVAYYIEQLDYKLDLIKKLIAQWT